MDESRANCKFLGDDYQSINPDDDSDAHYKDSHDGPMDPINSCNDRRTNPRYGRHSICALTFWLRELWKDQTTEHQAGHQGYDQHQHHYHHENRHKYRI